MASKKPDKPGPMKARDTSQPPAWAIATVVGSIGFVVLVSYLGDSTLRSIVPFADSAYFYAGLIALPMVVLVAVMLIVKLGEARKAAAWPQSTATILKSGMEARHHRHAGDTTTVTNAPAIEYEFTAKGRIWRGNRISIGDDTGGANSEATLARFPTGATVPVYYDPDDPTHCVLIRDLPQGTGKEGLGKGCAAIVAMLAALGAGLYFFSNAAVSYLDSHLPNRGEGKVVLFATLFGLVVLMFFVGAQRYSRQAQSWPSVPGQVINSGVESFRETSDGHTRTLYRAAVEYAYRVNGVDYRSRQIDLGFSASGSQGAAEKKAARYPEGAAVEVHYAPDNPTNGALENPTGYTWVLFGVALVCFVVAAYAGGLFKVLQ